MGFVELNGTRFEFDDAEVAHLEIACRKLLLRGTNFFLAIVTTGRESHVLQLGPNLPCHFARGETPRGTVNPAVVRKLVEMVERNGVMLTGISGELDDRSSAAIERMVEEFRRQLDAEDEGTI